MSSKTETFQHPIKRIYTKGELKRCSIGYSMAVNGVERTIYNIKYESHVPNFPMFTVYGKDEIPLFSVSADSVERVDYKPLEEYKLNDMT